MSDFTWGLVATCVVCVGMITTHIITGHPPSEHKHVKYEEIHIDEIMEMSDFKSAVWKVIDFDLVALRAANSALIAEAAQNAKIIAALRGERWPELVTQEERP